MTFAEFKDVLEAISFIATIIGIPVAIGVFIYQKREDQYAHEIDTYLRANDKYIQYLTLCLEYPSIGFADNSMNEPEVANSGFDVKQLTLFTILVSTLETGYLLYRNHKSAVREKQWQGWKEYMEYWASRTDFRKAWNVIGPQFDKDFQVFAENIIIENKITLNP